VLSKVKSRGKEFQNQWKEVRGPFTFKGHEQVEASLKDGAKELEREMWVVPLTREESQRGALIERTLERVRQDYNNDYITEWIEFFRDIDVEIPVNNKAAIDEFKVLSTPDWPYQRLLRALADNTQFDEVREQNEAEATLIEDGGVVDQIKR